MRQRAYLLKMFVALKVFLVLFIAKPTDGFAPESLRGTTTFSSPALPPSSSRLFLDASELGVEQMEARNQFFLWFFGASGAAGVARQSFPRMIDNIKEIQSFRDPELSTGGETVGINPLCGYPRDLSISDLNSIVNNRLSIADIAARFPVENNLWSKRGYITYQAFREANPNADPLAVRAVFDCFSQSTEVSNPEIAQGKIDRYQQSLDNFTSDLLYSKAVGWAAIITLLGLLGLADIEAYYHGSIGWFPDWPGGRLWLEGGLWDSEYGIQSIPKYWI